MRMLVAASVLFLAALLSAGCGKKEERSTGGARSYHFVGQVKEMDPSIGQITIAHGDIPNFMKAMTMAMVVKDSNLFRGISIGDSVRGVLVVQRPEIWLDSLAVIPKM